jgi:hypothetical protein
MSKTEDFGKVKWRQYAVNTNRSKTGNRLPTSQGDVVFTNDIKALKNPEQAAELKEKYPGIIKTVAREAPISSGNFTMTMPDMSHIFRKRNRMDVQDREEEERERRERNGQEEG